MSSRAEAGTISSAETSRGPSLAALWFGIGAAPVAHIQPPEWTLDALCAQTDPEANDNSWFVGFASGAHPIAVAVFIRGGGREYYAYSIDIATGRAMFEEAWELIVKAWTEPEPFDWHGEYYDYDVISVLPRPVQQPRQFGGREEQHRWRLAIS